LEIIFPQNWDLKLVPLFGSKFKEYRYEVTIRFPEFVIQNGKGLYHTIKDLYVFFKLKPKGGMMGKLQGKRGTLSYQEAACGYRHSHLPSEGYGVRGGNRNRRGQVRDLNEAGFQSFCLGSSEIQELVSLWNSDRFKFSQEEFELLLYQIDAYVRWESLQGGPHFRIANIGVGGNVNQFIQLSIKEQCYREFLQKSKDFECKFNKESGLFEIDSLAIEKRLRMKACPKVRRTPDGTYIMGDHTPHMIRNWIDHWNSQLKLVYEDMPAIDSFQGKSIELKVESFVDEKEEREIKQVPHPDVTKHVRSKLIVSMNHYFTSNYGK
jgi:hypothetical protein